MAQSKLIRKLAVGAAVAGAAGYLAGVLSAPKEGKKTRKDFKNSSERSITDLEKQLKALHSELNGLMNQAKGHSEDASDKAQKKFSGALNNAHNAKDKVREVLSSIHEGEANDKDLRKALDDAKGSLEHLKNFLKK